MKNILLLSSVTAGGAERMTLLYAKLLRDHGWQCRLLLTCYPHDRALLPAFIPNDIPYEVVRLNHGFLVNWQIAWHIYKCHPDVVFCSQPGNSRRVMRMKRRGLVKAKFVFRDFLMPSDQMANGSGAANKQLADSDAIIAQTQEMKDEMVAFYGFPADKVTVIHNPLDKQLIHESINEQFPFDHHYTNYVAINRIDKQKDIVTMLQAFALVCKQKADSRLYLCGNNSDEAYMSLLKNIVEENNLSTRVFFEGPQANPFKYINGADAFVLSSRYEGLPNSMLEALYLGKPVVVTRSIPFITQTVREGIDGFTVPVGNPEAFAQAMLKCLSLPPQPKFVDRTQSEEKLYDLFDSLIETR